MAYKPDSTTLLAEEEVLTSRVRIKLIAKEPPEE